MEGEWLAGAKLAGELTGGGVVIIYAALAILGIITGLAEVLHQFQRTLCPG
jgi:hypothetical protein